MEQTAGSTRMTKDQIIRELIDLLNQNQQRENANSVYEIAAYIDGMEKKMDAVMEELAEVRKQLSEVEDKLEKKTLKAALSGAVEKLEQQCQNMKQQIFEVKQEVRAKAAEIVTTVKQKGKAALNKVSELFHIKGKLQNIRQNVQESIAEVDRSIEKIDAFGTGMREAGRKAANTLRAFADRPEKEYGEKKISKTELLKKPFQAKRKLLSGMLNYADAAIEKTEQLAEDVRQRQDSEERIGGEILKAAEPEYQYGADAFEEYQRANADKAAEKAADMGKETKKVKSR